MKFKLLHFEGDKRWVFDLNARCVHSDVDCKIELISDSCADGVTAHLSQIPIRIDIDNMGTAWLMDAESDRLLPNPYKVVGSVESKTIFHR